MYLLCCRARRVAGKMANTGTSLSNWRLCLFQMLIQTLKVLDSGHSTIFEILVVQETLSAIVKSSQCFTVTGQHEVLIPGAPRLDTTYAPKVNRLSSAAVTPPARTAVGRLF